MSEDFFQHAEGQMQEPVSLGDSTMAITCYAVSTPLPSIVEAMGYAMQQLHDITEERFNQAQRDATTRERVANMEWISSSHDIQQIPGTEDFPTTYVASIWGVFNIIEGDRSLDDLERY